MNFLKIFHLSLLTSHITKVMTQSQSQPSTRESQKSTTSLSNNLAFHTADGRTFFLALEDQLPQGKHTAPPCQPAVLTKTTIGKLISTSSPKQKKQIEKEKATTELGKLICKEDSNQQNSALPLSNDDKKLSTTLALNFPVVKEYRVKRANHQLVIPPILGDAFQELATWDQALQPSWKELQASIALLQQYPQNPNEASRFTRHALLKFSEKSAQHLQHHLPFYAASMTLYFPRPANLDIAMDAAEIFLEQVSAERSSYEQLVPKKIHILATGELTPRVQDALYSQVLNNIDSYQITVVYDSTAFLVKLLGDRIRACAENESLVRGIVFDVTLNTPIQRAWTIQNHFFRKHSEWSSAEGLNFDEAAMRFMVEYLYASREALEDYLGNRRSSVAQLREKLSQTTVEFADSLNTVRFSNAQLYKNYKQELTLRNNPMALNLLKWRLLSRNGGFVFPVDTFPDLPNNLFPVALHIALEKIVKEYFQDHPLLSDTVFVKGTMQNIWYELVLDYLQKNGQLFSNTPYFPQDNWLNALSAKNQAALNLVQEIRATIEAYAVIPRDRKSLLEHFFLPLGDAKVGPAGIAMAGVYTGSDVRSVDTAILAALNHNELIKKEMSRIEQTYALIGKDNYEQYPELQKHIGQDWLSPVQDERHISFYRHSYGSKDFPLAVHVEDDMVPRLPSYRAYGFNAWTTETLFLADTKSFLRVMDDYLSKKIPENTLLNIAHHLRGESQMGAHNVALTEMKRRIINTYVLPQPLIGQWVAEGAGRFWGSNAITVDSHGLIRATQYDSIIILQLSAEEDVANAARFLANKHAERVTWLSLQKNNLGHWVPIKISSAPERDDGIPLPQKKIRLTVIGHGSAQHGDKTRISGFDGSELARLIADPLWRSRFFMPEQKVSRLNLVACYAGRCDLEIDVVNDVETKVVAGFAKDLLDGLWGKFSVDELSAYEKSLMVNQRGQKILSSGHRKWAHGARAVKMIFTQDERGAVSVKRGVNLDHLEEVIFDRHMAGPLSAPWGMRKEIGQIQKTTQTFFVRMNAVIDELQTHALHGWVPELETLHQREGVVIMQWRHQDADTALRQRHKAIIMHDTVFEEFLQYITKQSATLAEFQKTQQLPKGNALTKTSAILQQHRAQRLIDAYFSIRSLANLFVHLAANEDSPLGRAVALHSRFDVGQAAYALTEEGVALAKLAGRHLVKNKPFLSALISTAKVSQRLGQVVNPLLTGVNLGLSLNDFLSAQGTSRETIHAVQLGFDSASAAVTTFALITNAVGLPAVATIAGPMAMFLLAVQVRVQAILQYQENDHMARTQQALLKGHLTSMRNAYRNHGFTYHAENKTLAALPLAIVTDIDLRQTQVQIHLVSPTLSHLDSYLHAPADRGDDQGPLGGTPTHQVIVRTNSSRDGLAFSGPLQFAIGGQTLSNLSKDIHTIVLPTTPQTRFDYTVGSVSQHNEYDHPRALLHAAIPRLYAVANNNLRGNERITSLTPHYRNTTITTHLAAATYQLLVPPLQQDQKGLITYAMNGNGSVTTILPQPGVSFILNAGAQVSSWHIDSRHLPEDMVEYFICRKEDASQCVNENHGGALGFPRIIYFIEQKADAAQDIITHTNYRGHSARLGKDGKMKRVLHNANLASEESVINSLKRLAEYGRASDYIALTNLDREGEGGIHINDVGVFDVQREQLVYSMMSVENAAFVGAGARQAIGDYYFTDTHDNQRLWRIHGGERYIAAQYQVPFSEYNGVHIVGVSHTNQTTVLEQHVPFTLSGQNNQGLASTIRLLSTIDDNDQIKLVSLVFPPDGITPTLHRLRQMMQVSANAHIPHAPTIEPLLRVLLQLHPHANRQSFLDNLAHVTSHRASYATLIQLSGQDGAVPPQQVHAWLRQCNSTDHQTTIQLIEPRYTINGKVRPLPDLLGIEELGDELIMKTIDGRIYRAFENDAIQLGGNDIPYVQHHDDLKLIGLDANWIMSHRHTLATDIDRLVQETPATAHIMLQGFYEKSAGESIQKTDEDNNAFNANRTAVAPSSDRNLNKAIYAVYDVEKRQLLFVPSDLNQTDIEYLGHDGWQGGWLFDTQLKQLHNVDLLAPDKLPIFFTLDLQATVSHWKISRRILADEPLDDVRRLENGRILATTKEGLVFLVDRDEEREMGQGPLLMAATMAWQRAHQENFDADLAILTTRYATNNRAVEMLTI